MYKKWYIPGVRAELAAECILLVSEDIVLGVELGGLLVLPLRQGPHVTVTLHHHQCCASKYIEFGS